MEVVGVTGGMSLWCRFSICRFTSPPPPSQLYSARPVGLRVRVCNYAYHMCLYTELRIRAKCSTIIIMLSSTGPPPTLWCNVMQDSRRRRRRRFMRVGLMLCNGKLRPRSHLYSTKRLKTTIGLIVVSSRTRSTTRSGFPSTVTVMVSTTMTDFYNHTINDEPYRPACDVNHPPAPAVYNTLVNMTHPIQTTIN